MAEENSSSAAQDSGNLQNTLQLVLTQLREQKDELNLLREDLKGSAVSVKAEVCKLKEKRLTWKREGNKQQYLFNTEVEQDCEQASWAIANNKHGYAQELLKDCKEKIKKRNKLIRIADTSEAGWDTVKNYESNPVASDSDDENKINKAENRALRKWKQAATKRDAGKKRFTSTSVGPAATASSTGYKWGAAAHTPGNPAFTTATMPAGMHAFRGYSGKRPGSCFACGEFSHYRRECPYIINGNQGSEYVKGK